MRSDRFTRAALVATLALALTGCASTADSPFADPLNAAQSLISSFTVPPKFRQAVQREDWAAAIELYAAHPDLLDREASQEVATVAAALHAQWQERLQKERQQLASALAPKGFSPTVWTDSLSSARRAMQEYESEKLLARHRSPDAIALEQALAGAPSQLARSFSEIFADYDHASQPLLIRELTALPDRATQEAAVLENTKNLLLAIRRVSPEKAAELVRAYAPLLPEGQGRELRSAYLAKVSMARFGVVPQRLKPSQKLALASDQGAYGDIRALRLDAGHAPAPVMLDGNPVGRVVPLAQLGEIIREAAAAGDSLVVLIDSSLSMAVIGVEPGPTISERRQVGTQSRPNPEHEEALNEVRQLERELRNIELQNDELQRQSKALSQQSGGRGSSALAAVLGSTYGTTAVASVRNKLARAQASLAATPRMSEQPVYRNVPVQQVVRETKTTTQVIVYLVDVATQRAHRASRPFTAVQRETVTLAASSTPSRTNAATVNVRLSDFHSDLDKASAMSLTQLVAASRKEHTAHERRVAQLQQSADRSRAIPGAARTQPFLNAVAAGPVEMRGAARSTPNVCHDDLGYLDARLPRFQVQLLQNVREEGIRMNVLEVIRRAKSQGVSADEAVDQMQQAAMSMDAQVSVAGQCAAEIDALGTSDEAFIEGIRKGGLANLASCEGIRNGCLCAGMAARLGAYVTRAAATAMQCHARLGNW